MECGRQGRRRGRARPWRAPLSLAAAAGLAITSCSADNSIFNPKSPQSSEIAAIGWFMIAASGAIFLGVVIFLVAGILRQGEDATAPGDAGAPPPRRRYRISETSWIIGGGVLVPVLVLGSLSGWGVAVLATDDTAPELRIEVVGHQYWWEVRFPDHGFETANELKIPVDREVEIVLRSADVIHSFWVPQLSGKVDLVPGETNRLRLEGNEPGLYRGQCAEYCGVQHAHMIFLIEVVAAAEFEEWASHMAQPASEPETELARRGRAVLTTEPCRSCHTVRGTSADGEFGPELTHFASRRTIAAGTVPNTRGYLGGWVVNAQSIKPGSLMPPMHLEPGELQALLAYLEQLE